MAFVTSLDFCEWNWMPQGMTNTRSTFQRLIEECLGYLNRNNLLVFIDDLIISASLVEHERRLLQIFTRLKEFGLKLSPEKCKFFQTSVRYLGHIVSENRAESDPEKISTLKSCPTVNSREKQR